MAMQESSARLLVKEMKAAGITVVACLPDTVFSEVYFLIKEDPYFQFMPVTNEGEGVSIAAGAWLGGKKSLMVMENSGLRMAAEALSLLGINFGIPVLLLMSYRGCIGDGNWWAIDHGLVMEPILKSLRIPYSIIDSEQAIDGSLQRAIRTLNASKNHVAVVISGGALW